MSIRRAELADISAIESLIAESVRGLSRGFYSDTQIESALRHVFGVDSQLIADQTYYVVDDADALLAAGGWSRRRHLYGGDQTKDGEDLLLDPATEAARIRAFFVAPRAARQGLARKIYEECVSAARGEGFTRFELMATLPGVPLYLALGFVREDAMSLTLADGVDLPLVRMTQTFVRSEGYFPHP